MGTVGVERVLTTQLDAGVRLGVRAEANLQTGRAAQQVLHCAGVLVGNLARVNLYDRAREVFLAHGAVTDDHHFFQRLGVLFQGDGERLTALESHFFLGETDVGNDDGAACGNAFQLEVTVEIGHRAYVGGIFHFHGGTDNRFTILVDNRAFHNAALLSGLDSRCCCCGQWEYTHSCCQHHRHTELARWLHQISILHQIVVYVN